MTERTGESRTLALVAGLPAAGMAVASVVLCAMGLAGANPLWPRTDMTLSEAAALRDQVTVIRLLERGDSQDSRYTVRAGLVSGDMLNVTPMEAAIHENRTEIVDLLAARRAAPPPDEAVCAWIAQASARRGHDIVAFLQQKYPQSAAACRAGADAR